MEWLLLKSAPEPRMFQSAVSTAQVAKFRYTQLAKKTSDKDKTTKLRGGKDCMFTWEKKIWKLICDHLLIILIIGATLLSLIARWPMRSFLSNDMKNYLLLWFEQIKSQGGFSALKEQVGNYNIPYQTLIALLVHMPLDPILLYKISSSIFDFLQAYFLYLLVRDITQDKLKACLTYAIAVNLPTVMLNSCIWGQCDSIYTCFCILSLYFCFKEKYSWSFIFIGVAFSFKLQTIFLLPFLLFMYVYKKQFSFIQLLWIPLVMLIMSLGGLLQGRPIDSIIKIYINQVYDKPEMSLNYPSLWALMINNRTTEFYQNMRWYAILLTVFMLLFLTIIFLYRRKEYSNRILLEISFLMVYICVFTLPAMHERYGYMYIIIGLAIIMYQRKLILPYIILLIMDNIIYADFLFQLKPNWQVLAVINALCISAVMWIVIKDALNNEIPIRGTIAAYR
ncbi:MAG: glycosyltransferase 87 family protein [Lachnospiraceae bacterium]|nr:glycosyltransferase 87 family protein [Lachnospiraceae bacterium]